jgi:uncharacterized protein (DUF1778 family)
MERESEENDSESAEFEDDPIDEAFRRLLELDDETFGRFVELLDNPPEPSEGLRKLMSLKPPWEQ